MYRPFFVMNWFDLGYPGLFVLSFLAATILPLSSEGMLVLMLASGYDPFACIALASFGNILGGATNYWIGRLGNPKWLLRIGLSESKLNSFEQRIAKYGEWLALLSWTPFLGDPLTAALGFFRVHWWRVLLWMSTSKILRYIILSIPWLTA